MGSLPTLNLDQVVANPLAEVRGGGGALISALVRHAATSGRVAVAEPQSDGIEEYLARQGFTQAPQVDRYLWYYPDEPPAASGSEREQGTSGGPDLCLRYPLVDEAARDRLLAAFKRPPARISSFEEIFICNRRDQVASRVLALRVASGANAVRGKASVSLLLRDQPDEPYRLEATEDVDLIEAMLVTKKPDTLGGVEWSAARALCDRSEAAPGDAFVVLGRCSVSQRAYPLPGLLTSEAELVIDELELPLTYDPIMSVAIPVVPLRALADVTRATSELLSKFGARHGFYRNPEAWNLENVRSNGLLAPMDLSSDGIIGGDDESDYGEKLAADRDN